jgi:alpha-amylase
MVDENDRTKTVGEMHNIEGWTKFTFPRRGDKYSNMKWVRRASDATSRLRLQSQNYNHFTGVDYDAKTETTAIFKARLA